MDSSENGKEDVSEPEDGEILDEMEETDFVVHREYGSPRRKNTYHHRRRDDEKSRRRGGGHTHDTRQSRRLKTRNRTGGRGSSNSRDYLNYLESFGRRNQIIRANRLSSVSKESDNEHEIANPRDSRTSSRRSSTASSSNKRERASNENRSPTSSTGSRNRKSEPTISSKSKSFGNNISPQSSKEKTSTSDIKSTDHNASVEDVSADEMESSPPSVEMLSDMEEKAVPEIITLDSTDSSDGDSAKVEEMVNTKKTVSEIAGTFLDETTTHSNDSGSSTDFDASIIPSESEIGNELDVASKLASHSHNDDDDDEEENVAIEKDLTGSLTCAEPLNLNSTTAQQEENESNGEDAVHQHEPMAEMHNNSMEKDSHLSDEEIDVLELRNKLLSELVNRTDTPTLLNNSNKNIPVIDTALKLTDIAIKIVSSTERCPPLEIENNEEEEALREVVLSLMAKKKTDPSAIINNMSETTGMTVEEKSKPSTSTELGNKFESRKSSADTSSKSESRKSSTESRNRPESRKLSTETKLPSNIRKGNRRRSSNSSTSEQSRSRTRSPLRRRNSAASSSSRKRPAAGRDNYSRSRGRGRYRDQRSPRKECVNQKRPRAATMSPPLQRDVSHSPAPLLATNDSNSNESFLSAKFSNLPENDLRKHLLKQSGSLKLVTRDKPISNYSSLTSNGGMRPRPDDDLTIRRTVNFATEFNSTNAATTSVTWTESVVGSGHQTSLNNLNNMMQPGSVTNPQMATLLSQSQHTTHGLTNTTIATPSFTRFSNLSSGSGYPTEQQNFMPIMQSLQQTGDNAASSTSSHFVPTSQLHVKIPSLLPLDSSLIQNKAGLSPLIQPLGISPLANKSFVSPIPPSSTGLLNMPSTAIKDKSFEGAPLYKFGTISISASPAIQSIDELNNQLSPRTSLPTAISPTIASLSKAKAIASNIIPVTTSTVVPILASNKFVPINSIGSGSIAMSAVPSSSPLTVDAVTGNKSLLKSKPQLIVKVPQLQPSNKNSKPNKIPRIVIPVRDNDSTSDEMEEDSSDGKAEKMIPPKPPLGNDFQKSLDEFLKRARDASETKVAGKEANANSNKKANQVGSKSEEQKKEQPKPNPPTNTPTLPVIDKNVLSLSTSTKQAPAVIKMPTPSPVSDKLARSVVNDSRKDFPRDSPSLTVTHSPLLKLTENIVSRNQIRKQDVKTKPKPTPIATPGSAVKPVSKPEDAPPNTIISSTFTSSTPSSPKEKVVAIPYSNKKQINSPVKRPSPTSSSIPSNKKIIDELTKKVKESRNQLLLSEKEKELLTSRQSCFTGLREIQKSLQQHTRLHNLDAKFDSEIASVQKKLEQLKSKQLNVREKASNINKSIKDKSKLVLPLKANCISLEREVVKLGDRIFGDKQYKVTDFFQKDIETIVKEISSLSSRQPTSLKLERGVIFHQVISDIDPTSTLANNDFSNIQDANEIVKRKTQQNPPNSSSSTISSAEKPETVTQQILPKKSTVSSTSGSNKNISDKPPGAEDVTSSSNPAKSVFPNTFVEDKELFFLTRHGLESELPMEKESNASSTGFLTGDMLQETNLQSHSLTTSKYIGVMMPTHTGTTAVKLDPNVQLCSESLEKGVCLTKGCSFQHI